MTDIETPVNGTGVIGSWRLVSARAWADGVDNDAPLGRAQEAFSPTPLAVECRRSSRTAAAGLYRRLHRVSDHQRAEAFATSFAYAGRYSLAGDEVTHHVEVSTVENWVNTDLVRLIRFDGDRLVVRTSPMPIEGKIQVTELVWERIA